MTQSQVVEVDGISLSYRASWVREPRAVVLALHGGATTSTYFDCPDLPRLSLLRTAADLGFGVLALDRPGYGASLDRAAQLTDPARRVDLSYAALDRLLADRPRGAGVFLLAHSAGCELAVRMAADPRGHDLLGLEIAGTGRHHHPRSLNFLEFGPEDDLRRSGRARARLREVLWGPSHLYPPEVAGGASIAAESPPYESAARHWRYELPELAARVRIPVQYSLGDHEEVWSSGPDALADIAALFTASPRVRVNEQPDSGHNLSLGHSARAYHLKVLSFAEESAVTRENACAQAREGRAG
ncbi:alpha/beta fold hydrolase [Streptomyces sp. SID13726]|uniref:alpha/beta hydrolase n=1 Tax=Streptomyces sp. SID13726 TaxID=2706058 RepID=UPI0013BC93D0|nr:alpha/beta fold hydrolase [Streptomyces sp. SID13726]NEB02760.1 alpha/beta fold hydrolase [Streptomyces sp. SID13726]